MGFYRFEREFRSNAWALGAPIILAEAVVDAWKDRKPNQAEIAVVKAFVEHELD